MTTSQSKVTPFLQRSQYLTLRITGVMLAVLALGHFGVTHIFYDVAETDSDFVLRRWSSTLWIVWDGLLLGTALLHGFAGLVTFIRDHRPDPISAGFWIKVSGGAAFVLFMVGITTLMVSIIGKT